MLGSPAAVWAARYNPVTTHIAPLPTSKALERFPVATHSSCAKVGWYQDEHSPSRKRGSKCWNHSRPCHHVKNECNERWNPLIPLLGCSKVSIWVGPLEIDWICYGTSVLGVLPVCIRVCWNLKNTMCLAQSPHSAHKVRLPTACHSLSFPAWKTWLPVVKKTSKSTSCLVFRNIRLFPSKIGVHNRFNYLNDWSSVMFHWAQQSFIAPWPSLRAGPRARSGSDDSTKPQGGRGWRGTTPTTALPHGNAQGKPMRSMRSPSFLGKSRAVLTNGESRVFSYLITNGDVTGLDLRGSICLTDKQIAG